DRAQHFVFQQDAQAVGNGKTAAESGSELHKQFGAGGVQLFHVDFQVLEHSRIAVQPAAADGVTQGRNARNDQAHVVFGNVQKELRRHFVKVVGLHPAKQGGSAHGTHDDAVFDLHIADLPGGEQRIIAR